MQQHAHKPLAIIGMGCRLPGANNLDEYWDMLLNGKYPLGELPPERLDRELYYDPKKGVCGKSYTVLGGITQPKPLDRTRCPVPDRLVDDTHQIHLNLCEVAADAIHDANWDIDKLAGSRTGVYVGHTPPGMLSGEVTYAKLVAHTVRYLSEVDGFAELAGSDPEAVFAEIVRQVRSEFSDTDKRLNVCLSAYPAAAVIAQTFGLDGPCMTFDAACASSLRALGHAARALQSGQIEAAIVGGASVCNTDALVLFSAAQSVSPTGSRPFDEGADGLVTSEGYVAIALKTLEKAVADGDHIQAVIRGLGISSDGKGKSLWAPRREGQIEAMRRAYASGIDPKRLQFIEAHATSTQVGDATELGALKEVFEEHLPPGHRIPVGSAKANVGHTLESAGLTSLIKTVLALKHGIIPPQINVRTLNAQVDWENLPFYVPTQPVEWNRLADGVSRMAAVNAFGIGGLNVHVVIDEHLPAASPVVSAPAAESDSAIREPIAIIGMGAVLPGARTIDGLWDLFRSEVDQKQDVPADRWDSSIGYDPSGRQPWTTSSKRGGFITDFEYDWKAHKVPPKQIQTADPLQFMLLDAADQAFKNAGYGNMEFDKTRCGVLVGTIFGGEFGDQLQVGMHLPQFRRTLKQVLTARGISEAKIEPVAEAFQKLLLKRMPALVDETGSFTASTLASRITKTFDLMGGATAIDAGDASAMAALSSCVDLLRAGDCDMMICAAGQRAMSFAQFEFRNRKQLLAIGEGTGPFDADASGYMPGEGVGVVLLKRLSDAQRDGDRIHGIIHGIGAAMSDSVEDAVTKAIHRSIEASGLTPADVSFLESGASGVPSRDREEFAAVTAAYDVDNRDEPLLLGSAAGQIGHTIGGSGMVSLLKATAELEHVEMTRNVDLQKPAAYLSENSAHLTCVNRRTAVPVSRDDGRMFAGVSCVSQYNLAYHVLLERPTKVEKPKTLPETTATPPAATHAHTSNSAWRTVRLAAASMQQLAESAAHAVSDANALFENAAACDGFTDEAAAKCFRLAIVVDRPEDLADRLQLAAAQMANPKAKTLLGEKGIFFGEVAVTRPQVAFLFPGQGSQYNGMLKSLIDDLPAAQAALQEVDATLAAAGLPTFARLAWETDHNEISEVWRTQLSLIAADAIVYAAAWSLGLRADRVAGHSFGELAALTAAGSWTFAEAVNATRGRCASIDSFQGENGVMLSTSAPAMTLEHLCRQVGGRVSVSHCNAPDQTVAGGDAAPITQLAEVVKQAGFLAKVLDVPAAFHTPLMEPVKEPFARALAEVGIQPPRIPLLSSVTNKYVADPCDIRENLVNQMTKPIDYVGLAQRLSADGITVFVEVGPRQVLTGLTKRVLEETGATVVACDHPKRNGLQQLLFAKAALEVIGAADRPVESAPFASTRHLPKESAPVITTTETLSAGIDPNADVLSTHGGIQVLRLSGSPYEMGYRHGTAQADEIRQVLRRYADIAGSPWDRVVDLDTLVSLPETFFGADELEELRGIAKGAGVTFSSVVAHNLRLYLDAGSGGIHFAVTAKENPADGLLHGVNEDLRNGLSVRDCLERHVQVRKPNSGIPHVTFGVVGQVGTLNGINEKGLAVSTAVLLDADPVHATENRRLHTVLVKNVLENAANIDDAVAILEKTSSMARWGLCLSHHPSDRVSYVEFDGSELRVDPALPKVIAANHRLMKSVADQVPQPSQLRLDRLRGLLGENPSTNVSPSVAREALRDRYDVKRGKTADLPNMNMVRRVDNQISIVMQPAKGDIWLTPGPTANGHQNEFQHLNLQDLFRSPPKQANAETAGETISTVSQNSGPATIDAEAFAKLADRIKSDAIDDDGRICHRFVLRLLDSPLSDAVESRVPWNERSLILGDNPVADVLQKTIESRGGSAVRIPSNDDVDAVIAAIETASAAGPATQLFLTTPFDIDAKTSLDANAWNHRMTRGVLVPFLACQRWYQLVNDAKLTDSAGVTAVTALGGDFGISGNVHGAESGALAGLLKDLHLEVGQKNQHGFRVKIVDFAGDAPANTIATTLERELSRVSDAVEIGYADGTRYTPVPVFEPVPPRTTASAKTTQGAWVITGGARGITAVVAREIGRRFGAKLHLVGSTPLPEIPETWHALTPAELKELRASVMKEALANGEKPVDAWTRYEKALEVDKTLREFAAMGVSATYHACDVGNRAALARVLDAVRAADGPIRGIVHGAGFERAGRFDKKKREFIERTFLPKLNGAAALMELTKNDPLQYFMAFSSVAGRFGAVGQADYASANEMLGKLVDWFRGQRPSCHSASFYWHLWGEVGMAVRPETKGYFEALDMNFLPTAEGVNHLIDEALAGMPEPEVVVTDWKLYRFHTLGDTAGIPGMTPEANAPKPKAAQPKVLTVSDFPMLDRVIEHTPGIQLTAEVELDPQGDAFLAQHRYKGRPLMPLVATIETMTEAAALLAGPSQSVKAVRNIEILNGLRFPTDDHQTARVHAEMHGDEIVCQWTSDLHNRAGQLLLKNRPYLKCVVEVTDQPQDIVAELPEPRGSFNPIPYPHDDSAVMYHGDALRTLQNVAIEGEESWGRLIAPDPRELGGHRKGDQWLASMSLLDGCFYASGVTLWFKENGAVSVPSQMERLALGRQPRPGEHCTVHVQNRGRRDNLATHDLTLFGDDGAVLLQVIGHTMMIVAEGAPNAAG